MKPAHRRYTPNEFILAGCFGKERYSDPALARKVANRILRRGKHVVQVYRCEFCNGFHHGSPRVGK